MVNLPHQKWNGGALHPAEGWQRAIGCIRNIISVLREYDVIVKTPRSEYLDNFCNKRSMSTLWRLGMWRSNQNITFTLHASNRARMRINGWRILKGIVTLSSNRTNKSQSLSNSSIWVDYLSEKCRNLTNPKRNIVEKFRKIWRKSRHGSRCLPRGSTVKESLCRKSRFLDYQLIEACYGFWCKTRESIWVAIKTLQWQRTGCPALEEVPCKKHQERFLPHHTYIWQVLLYRNLIARFLKIVMLLRVNSHHKRNYYEFSFSRQGV